MKSEKVKKSIHKRPWFIILCVLLVLGVFSNALGNDDSVEPVSVPVASEPSQTELQPEAETSPPVVRDDSQETNEQPEITLPPEELNTAAEDSVEFGQASTESPQPVEHLPERQDSNPSVASNSQQAPTTPNAARSAPEPPALPNQGAEPEASPMPQSSASQPQISPPQEPQTTDQSTLIGRTVYWVPNGEVYHSTSGCRSLARSTDIRSGTIEQSGKSRGCRICT